MDHHHKLKESSGSEGHTTSSLPLLEKSGATSRKSRKDGSEESKIRRRSLSASLCSRSAPSSRNASPVPFDHATNNNGTNSEPWQALSTCSSNSANASSGEDSLRDTLKKSFRSFSVPKQEKSNNPKLFAALESRMASSSERSGTDTPLRSESPNPSRLKSSKSKGSTKKEIVGKFIAMEKRELERDKALHQLTVENEELRKIIEENTRELKKVTTATANANRNKKKNIYEEDDEEEEEYINYGCCPCLF